MKRHSLAERDDWRYVRRGEATVSEEGDAPWGPSTDSLWAVESPFWCRGKL